MTVCLALEEGLPTSAAFLVWGCRLSEPAGLQNRFLPAPFLRAAASFATNSNPTRTLLQWKRSSWLGTTENAKLVLVGSLLPFQPSARKPIHPMMSYLVQNGWSSVGNESGLSLVSWNHLVPIIPPPPLLISTMVYTSASSKCQSSNSRFKYGCNFMPPNFLRYL